MIRECEERVRDDLSRPELAGLLFVMLGREALLDEQLDKNDILVYVSLCSFMDNATRTLFPAIETIAKRARLSQREAIYCVKKLISLDYVQKKRRSQKSNLYKITSKGFFAEDKDDWDTKLVKELEKKPDNSCSAQHALQESKTDQKNSYSAQHALHEVHTMHTNYTHINYIVLYCTELRFSENETQKILKIAEEESAVPETIKQVLTEFDRLDKSKLKRPLGWIRNRIREIHIENSLMERAQTATPAESKQPKPLVVIVKDERRTEKEEARPKDKAKESKYEKFYL